MSRLKPQFFPKDLQYLSFVEIWLPEDAPLTATREVADRVEGLIQTHAQEYFAHHAGKHGEGGMVSLTTFIGGGGPRFWYSFAPEPRQTHYALIVMQTRSKWDTPGLIRALQDVLSREVAGARLDLRELENGPPIGLPVAIRLSGDHIPTLRALSAQLMEILQRNPHAERVHEDWGPTSFAVDVGIDPDRATRAGLTNADIAVSTAIGLNGLELTRMYDGDERVPVIAWLHGGARSRPTQQPVRLQLEGGQKVSGARSPRSRPGCDRRRSSAGTSSAPSPSRHGPAAVRSPRRWWRIPWTRFAASPIACPPASGSRSRESRRSRMKGSPR
jgi:multidrug efflux pump subunit AcrB